MHLFVSCDTVAFRHCVLGKSWLWLFLLGPAPFAFCFVSLLDGEAHIWLGDLRFALCGLGLLFLLCFDLPTYMTTGVHVDVILTCFFSCKDRASERYRPHQRKKKTHIMDWRCATDPRRSCSCSAQCDSYCLPNNMAFEAIGGTSCLQPQLKPWRSSWKTHPSPGQEYPNQRNACLRSCVDRSIDVARSG